VDPEKLPTLNTGISRCTKPMPSEHPISGRQPDRRMFLKATGVLAAGLVTHTAIPLADCSASKYPSSGTKKMADLLRQIWEQSDWKTDPNKPAERAAYYSTLLKGDLSLEQEFNIRFVLGKELLRSGASNEAVQTLESLAQSCRDRGIQLPPDVDRQLQHWIGISYLRLGEQENCASMHGQKSCIFPIRGSGVHSRMRGAEGARKAFAALLEQDPHDQVARWLLNIACMQLGQYPKGVPARWLVPVERFRSEYEIGDFLDVAPQAGVASVGHAGGVILEDFDRDGNLDLMISSWFPTEQLRYFRNNADGSFTERTHEAGLLGETGGLNIVQGDYNNDGYADVLVLRGGWLAKFGEYPMSLLRNNGNGTFDDVTQAAGLLSLHPTQTAAWADYDNDGWLDLFVGVESTPGNPHHSQLFHNNGDGTFTEVAVPHGLADLGFVKGVAWGDFNNDGLPDLYVSIMNGANLLFRNDGPRDPRHPRGDQWKFTEIGRAAGVTAPRDSFGTWFFDYDNDGWPDIFVAGYSSDSLDDVVNFEIGNSSPCEQPRLYRNNRNGTFTDMTKEVRLNRCILAMGASFGDLNNDGWLDIYLGTGEPAYECLIPNKMFLNHEGRVFLDVTTSGGFGHLQKGHGIAFGDIENNGNEDIFEVMGGQLPGDSYQCVLYRNPGHGNHWITLELEGVRTNRAAFGARIAVTFRDQGVRRCVYRTVGYGSSFGGNPLRQHIGIGKAESVERVEIFWPVSRSTQLFNDLPIDRTFHIRENAAKPIPVPRRSFAFDTIPMTKDSMGMQH